MNSETFGDGPQWCEERLRQPHEDLHLARLFTAPELRPAATATGAIYVELEAIATDFRDLNIARTKFAWWREELARLDSGAPAHPATRLLAEAGIPPATNRLLDLVTGMELNLLTGPPDDPATAALYAERGFAQLIAVLGLQLDAKSGGDGASEAKDYRPLGAGIGLARILTGQLAGEVRKEIAAAARSKIRAERATLRASPPTLRVLGALAWRRARRPAQPEPAERANRGRVFVAWRAARGKPPRPLRRS